MSLTSADGILTTTGQQATVKSKHGNGTAEPERRFFSKNMQRLVVQNAPEWKAYCEESV